MGKQIWAVVIGLLVLAAAWAGYVAAGVGREASDIDGMLKAAVSQRATKDTIEKQLTDAGYKIDQEDPTVKASGPEHSFVVFSTHLTVELEFERDGSLSSYHLDRS